MPLREFTIKASRSADGKGIVRLFAVGESDTEVFRRFAQRGWHVLSICGIDDDDEWEPVDADHPQRTA